MEDTKIYTIPTEEAAKFMVSFPVFVGGYRLGKGAYSWKLNLEHKPRWIHRTCMRVFLGIVWEDNE